jgi:hypothetical protein
MLSPGSRQRSLMQRIIVAQLCARRDADAVNVKLSDDNSNGVSFTRISQAARAKPSPKKWPQRFALRPIALEELPSFTGCYWTISIRLL